MRYIGYNVSSMDLTLYLDILIFANYHKSLFPSNNNILRCFDVKDMMINCNM